MSQVSDAVRLNVELAARSVICPLETGLFLHEKGTPVRIAAEHFLADRPWLIAKIKYLATHIAFIPRGVTSKEYAMHVLTNVNDCSEEDILRQVEIYLKRFGY